MKHLDLFSGIGGFALAVDRVWPGSEHIFCDNDPFCQQVIKKHWPTSKIYGDIRAIADPANQREKGLGLERKQDSENSEFSGIDILTGGFPCQPFSQAGKRKAHNDDRFLWPEMLRVIRTVHPTWIVGENVAGIINLALEQVCSELEDSGYEVQAFIIPAVAVNAPHRRDRVWIIAHSKSVRGHGGGREQYGIDKRIIQPEKQKRHTTRRESAGRDWNDNWLEIATELCGVANGLPAELDGFKLTHSAHRTSRLKSLGNAIVPQVAEVILTAIKNQ